MDAKRTVLLMYHRVLPDTAAAFGVPCCYRLRGTAITPAELQNQLDWLSHHQIPVLPLSEVMNACHRKEPPPPGVVLTFDDGYAEWLTVVQPELQSRRLSASFFVSSGVHADMAHAHPIDEYYFLLDNAAFPELSITLPDGQRVVADLRVSSQKWDLVRGPLKQRIICGSAIEQRAILSQLGATLGVMPSARLPAALYLPRTAWAQLALSGSRVENHGHSHRRLTDLPDVEIDRELTLCLGSVRAHVGDAQYFAYPDGAVDDRVAARIAAAGLKGAVTVVPGDVTCASDRFRLPRYFVRAGVSLDELLR